MRIVDPEAMRRARLRIDECAACGGPSNNLHHVVQKGSPHFGDDVYENVVGICGSGTERCHGAIHGSPYMEHVYDWDGDPLDSSRIERRDAEWVGRNIGLYLAHHRTDVIVYVLGKLGEDAGKEFLRRFYYLEAP